MHKFYVNPIALWRLAFPAAVAGALVGRAVLWAQGVPFHWPVTVGLVLIVATLVAASTFMQPTVVGPQGITALTMLGNRRTVNWDAIDSVTLSKLFGLLPALKMKARTGQALWLPLATFRLPELYAQVCQHAGDKHPLAQALRTPLYAC